MDALVLVLGDSRLNKGKGRADGCDPFAGSQVAISGSSSDVTA